MSPTKTREGNLGQSREESAREEEEVVVVVSCERRPSGGRHLHAREVRIRAIPRNDVRLRAPGNAPVVPGHTSGLSQHNVRASPNEDARLVLAGVRVRVGDCPRVHARACA